MSENDQAIVAGREQLEELGLAIELFDRLWTEFPMLILFPSIVQMVVARLWMEAKKRMTNREFLEAHATAVGIMTIAGICLMAMNGISGCDAAAGTKSQ